MLKLPFCVISKWKECVLLCPNVAHQNLLYALFKLV